MATLTNKQIDLTYQGLLKTEDEAAISGSLKRVQDGVGNNSGIELAANGANYTTTIASDDTYTHGLTVGNTGILTGGTVNFQTSSVDFTNATVIGLPTTNTTYDFGAVGAVGNINFALSGSDSSNDVVTMQAGTNVTLTDNGTNTFTIDVAGGQPGLTDDGATTIYSTVGTTPVSLLNTPLKTIAIGNNTSVNGGTGGVVIGSDVNVAGEGSVVIGFNASNGDIYGTSVGANSRSGYFGIAMGYGANGSNYSVALGADAATETDYGIAIGNFAQSKAEHNISIGHNSLVDDAIRVNTVVIGSGSGQTKAAQYSTAVGSQSIAVGDFAVALGYGAAANFSGSVALGANVQAVANNTATVNRLHVADYANINFPDDTAAGANGIPLGGVYHNNGKLQIRIN